MTSGTISIVPEPRSHKFNANEPDDNVRVKYEYDFKSVPIRFELGRREIGGIMHYSCEAANLAPPPSFHAPTCKRRLLRCPPASPEYADERLDLFVTEGNF